MTKLEARGLIAGRQYHMFYGVISPEPLRGINPAPKEAGGDMPAFHLIGACSILPCTHCDNDTGTPQQKPANKWT
jgi:hypothetical protein